MHITLFSLTAAVIFSVASAASSQEAAKSSALDARVQEFLTKSADSWHDLNISDDDGKILHDIIVSHHYTRALEIGTSTGRSGIWIARALAKTGGKLITIEIDESRRAQALANFKEAGLIAFIDSRLGNAHTIVPALAGPFDFVFSDADKDWYARYLDMLMPKLTPGGCFTAHNVLNRIAGIDEFLAHLKEFPDLETTIERGGGSGISVSYRKKEK